MVHVNCRVCHTQTVCVPTDENPTGDLCHNCRPMPRCCPDQFEAARRGCRCGGGSR